MSHYIHQFFNVLICTEGKGNGCSSILNKIGGNLHHGGLVEFIYLNNNVGHNISNVIKKQYTTRRKDGRYYPYLNSKMLMIIDDLNISDDNKQYMNSLITHSHDILSHRNFAKTTYLSSINDEPSS